MGGEPGTCREKAQTLSFVALCALGDLFYKCVLVLQGPSCTLAWSLVGVHVCLQQHACQRGVQHSLLLAMHKHDTTSPQLNASYPAIQPCHVPNECTGSFHEMLSAAKGPTPACCVCRSRAMCSLTAT